MRYSMFALPLLAGLFLLSGKELDVKGDFQTWKKGTPAGWRFNQWNGFQPLAEMRLIEESDLRVLHIDHAMAKHGFGVLSEKHFPAKSGDRILVSAKVRGKGEIAFHLWCYGNKKQLGATRKSFLTLTDQWREHTFELLVTDMPSGMTEEVQISFSGARNTELFITGITAVQQEAEYAGNLRFPAKWRIFGPVPATFRAPENVLTGGVPDQLNGAAGKDVMLSAGKIDFRILYGSQKAHVCGWAFAEIESPYDCRYTIGAGADWWMQYFVNGRIMIDTSDSGNGKHPVSYSDHIATVPLKKGKNLLAVRFITGGGSSILALGGADELRLSRKSFRTVKIFQSDDYDTPRQRSGNPRLIQGYPTFGVYTLTGQGVYTAEPATVIADNAGPYKLPREKGNEYLAAGLRIQSIAKDTDTTVFFDCGGNSGMKISTRRGDSNLFFSLIFNGVEQKRGVLPLSLLPADFIFAQKNDENCAAVKSLVDSSSRFLKHSRIPSDNATATLNLTVRAENGSRTQIVVDNFFIATVVPEEKAAIPYISERSETFDPAKNGWRLVWHDEFDGGEIDWKDRWFVPAWSKDRTRDFAKVDGKGFLHIFPGINPKTGKVNTAMLWSRQTFAYGYFEARLRFTRSPGWNAAFWCIGNGRNPMTGGGYEIDIFEDYYTRPRYGSAHSGGSVILDHNLHAYLGNKTLKSFNHASRIPGSMDDFYVIGAKWTPFEISYYLNGKLLRSIAKDPVAFNAFENAFCMTPVHVILSAKIHNGTEKPPAEEFLVDYVRVWQEPEGIRPAAVWKTFPEKSIVAPGEKFRLGISATPSGRTRSPVAIACLFDNGYLIDYKTEEPFVFDVAIDPVHYNGTAYMSTGRQRQKPLLDGYPHFFSIAVQDAAGKVASTPVRPVIVRRKASVPHQGVSRSIPGDIQAGMFDDGGLNTAYYSAEEPERRTPIRLNVNEWVSYTLDAEKSGYYDLELAAAGGTSGESLLCVYVDGRLTADCAYSHAERTFRIKNLKLEQGRHVFTILRRGNTGLLLQTLKFRKAHRP